MGKLEFHMPLLDLLKSHYIGRQALTSTGTKEITGIEKNEFGSLVLTLKRLQTIPSPEVKCLLSELLYSISIKRAFWVN